MSQQRHFKYFAFISYSRRDEAFAKRLQKFLMGFKLPTRLCKQYPELPKTLRPIYRDMTDLGVDKLNQGLTHGLSLSKYLIVICSENSARPNREGKNWIDEEVRTFLSLEEGNTDHVIPVLLRQKGQRIAECTPPAVRELGLLAADISDKGEKRVFNDVAAKMLGLEPDELWNWWERERRRKRHIRYALVATAALAIGSGWLLWDYTTPHYSYFADYAERHNLPEGIHPLSETDIKKRTKHYCFTSRFHNLRRVEALNAKGLPPSLREAPEQAGRPDVITLDYDNLSSERPAHQTYFFSRRGEQAEQERDVSDDLIILHPDRQTSRNGFELCTIAQEFAEKGNDETPKKRNRDKNVGRIQLKRNSHGFIEQEEYWADQHFRIRNEEGVWGRRFKRDEKGRIIEALSLDDHGQAMNNCAGIARTVYEYSPQDGELQLIAYFDSTGRPVPGLDGYSEARFQREDGRIRSCYLFNGESGYRDTFNCGGKLIERTMVDYNGNLRRGPGGYAGYSVNYDSMGRAVTRQYFDSSHVPCSVKKGYAGYHMRYDERGKETYRLFIDTEGAPCKHADGYAAYYLTYDIRGNEISRTFLDEMGRPCLLNAGYAGYRLTYDTQEQETSRAFFDTEGKPCMLKDGYASYQCTHDEDGNEISRAFFDTEGKPCILKDGYASYRCMYDESGNEISRAFFDPEGTPCELKDGYASYRCMYDESGNEISRAFFNSKGCPCTIKDGYARICRLYDGNGRIIAVFYEDENGNLIEK